MRWLFLIVIVACLAVQYPLRWGDTGYAQVEVLDRRLKQQLAHNRALEARNHAMQAEIDDLREGTEALEERARGQLNLIKEPENLVQIVDE